MSKEKVIEVEAKVVSSELKNQTDDIIEILQNGNSRYLITLTLLSGDKLSHHLITKNFPELDVLKSIGAVEKMAVERLKAL